MRNKTIIVPNHYILDEISINDISLAFVDAMQKIMSNESDWLRQMIGLERVFMNYNDANFICQGLKGMYVSLFYKNKLYKLEIKDGKGLLPNEIRFT